MPPLPSLPDARVLIVGLARDIASDLPASVAGLRRAFAGCADLRWLIVESDSTDDTVQTLAGLADTVPGFDTISLGALAGTLPERTARIAHCRNAYMERIESDPAYGDIDIVVMADLDGINRHLTAKAVESCWSGPQDWAMCAANQGARYYDIWALRHPLWSPNDCWETYTWLQGMTGERVRNRERAIFDRMIHIPADADWIEVDSAFGGLALYRRAAILGCRYEGQRADGGPICEHVPFHAQMRAKGDRLYINPALINAGVTEHTRKLQRRRAVPRALHLAWLTLTRRG